MNLRLMMKILGGLLLLFGGVVMVYHGRIRQDELQWSHNPIMRNDIIAVITGIAGFVTGLYSIYYWVHHFGWVPGLISFAAAGIVSGLICNFTSGFFPVVLGIGFLALVAGYFITFLAL